jgi:hypothetical protein
MIIYQYLYTKYIECVAIQNAFYYNAMYSSHSQVESSSHLKGSLS